MTGKDTGETGFSLIEVLVAIGIGVVVTGGIYNFYISQQKMYVVQEQVIEMEQNLRVSIDIIARRLQMAGYDPQGAKIFGSTAYQGAIPFFPDSNSLPLSLTTNTELYFTTDNSGDGVIDKNPDERVGFRVNGNTLQLASISSVDGSINSWEPVAENIESITVSYTYADGAVSSGTTNLPDNAVSGKKFDDIRAVTLSARAKTSKPDPDYTDPVFGDHYRRMTLTSGVSPRNLGY